ncbi:MAG: DUF4115 domain-containing protein [Gammaproteobacteria bacterium]|nr:DUF4115 domain-containing protein [Gammaproteobacteria bacterium]
MADDKDKTEAESESAEPAGPQGGARLAAARRALQIPVVDIAKELHLDEPKVEALERNEFDVLGAPVFAKGHLKKYAQLVRVDEGDVMADYYELTRAAGVPPLVTTRRKPRREMAPGPWIAVIVVIIVVASAYWWLTSRPPGLTAPPPTDAALTDVLERDDAPETSAVTAADDVASSVADDRLAVDQAADLAVDQAADLPGAGEGEPADARTGAADADDSEVLAAAAAASEADEPPPPELEAGQIRLLVTYRGDCWTEITDARGRRLFFDLGKDGRTVELSGDAPFNALFGNADNVAIRVNGADRSISDDERRGRTARLTIDAP